MSDSAIRGAFGGLLASSAMSTFLRAAELAGALERPPPRIITDGGLERLGLRPPRAARAALAVGGHGLYGGSMGAGFALLVGARPSLGRRPVLAGAGWGVAVWAASYAGWIPLAGIMPPPYRDRRARALAIAAAHVVYGASLGRRLARWGPAGPGSGPRPG